MEYDEQGRVATVGYRNANQFPRANGEGVFGQAFTYAGGLLATRVENLGVDGMAQDNRLGIRLQVIERSSLGDVIANRYFDKKERPTLHQNGYHA